MLIERQARPSRRGLCLDHQRSRGSCNERLGSRLLISGFQRVRRRPVSSGAGLSFLAARNKSRLVSCFDHISRVSYSKAQVRGRLLLAPLLSLECWSCSSAGDGMVFQLNRNQAQTQSKQTAEMASYRAPGDEPLLKHERNRNPKRRRSFAKDTFASLG